ncbi:leucine/isoleucine/valine transporter permease subunit [Pandoraea terrae]|uniref:Leucine/isoleucine/valine transporter permease subunit n=1 Tax=Pandoraea terrae TaxID=1537710 RepID=A0A5E4VLP7_9BURK|nr:high-affinity branched-chain amino acid ABC transporter permease LivM [Pandoraea terrae]VVE13287.1 leucine/isoleucine/valine transporter permease subunit [Pandoraea terrae]
MKLLELTRSPLGRAALAAAVTAILTLPMLALPLRHDGLTVVLANEWHRMALAAAGVFVFQMLRPVVARAYKAGASGVSASSAASLSTLASVMSGSRKPIAMAAVLAGAVLFPWVASRGAVDVGTLALIYVMLGLGLNIVVGYAGLLDLGYVGFYAVGGYTYALLNQHFGLSFWQCLPLAAGMAALFGFLLGFPVLRLRGDYLAIVTLGFGEIIRLLLNNLTDWTGGPDGIAGIPKPTLFGVEVARTASTEGASTWHERMGWTYHGDHAVIFLYLLALVLAVATYAVTRRLARMPIGRAWEALREDEIACRSLGLDPTRIKLSAFTLGAMFAGVAGAFYAARQGLVNPESFTFIESALVLAIVVLGGMGSAAGVVLAAVLLTALPELARGFSEYRMALFGMVMVAMMMWRPQGLLPARRQIVEVTR